jgi:hypothetical protein
MRTKLFILKRSEFERRQPMTDGRREEKAFGCFPATAEAEGTPPRREWHVTIALFLGFFFQKPRTDEIL